MDLISLDTYPSSYKGSAITDDKSYHNKSDYKEYNDNWVPYPNLQDCFIKGCKTYFDVISQGLCKAKTRYSTKKLRNLLYKYLVNNEPHYKIAKGLKTKKQLANYVKTFNGDLETLNMLSKLLNIDFYIFDSGVLPKEISSSNNQLLLIDTAPGILGLKDSKKLPQTLFNRNNLPQVLANIIDPCIYFRNCVNEFYNNNKHNFTLPNLYNFLETKITKKLDHHEKLITIGILKNLLKTINLKNHKIKHKSPIKLQFHNSSNKPRSSSKSSKKSNLSHKKSRLSTKKSKSLKRSNLSHKKSSFRKRYRKIRKRAIRPIKRIKN